MNTGLIVNVVLLFVAGFIALTFLRAMYPLYHSLAVQREKTRLQVEAMKDPNWVDMPKEAKKGPTIKERFIKFIKNEKGLEEASVEHK